MTEDVARPAPAPTAAIGADAPASVWRRLAGLTYDLIAVVAIVMVVGMASQAATLGHLVQTGAEPSIAWWYRPLQYLIVAAYFVLSWIRGGQTLGMRPWRMHLRMPDHQPVTLRCAVIRVAVVSLPLLALTLGHVASTRVAMLAPLAFWIVLFAPAAFDRRRRALHDIIAGTELVHPRKPPRTARR